MKLIVEIDVTTTRDQDPRARVTTEETVRQAIIDQLRPWMDATTTLPRFGFVITRVSDG